MLFLGMVLFLSGVVFAGPGDATRSAAGAAISGDATYGAAGAAAPGDSLRVVLIRHAEKPKKGGNLNCQGLNRSWELPRMLHSRFGLPAAIFVPAMDPGDSTKHARMFQTVVPFAAKYNLVITSRFHEDDTTELAVAVREKKGTVLIVWEHSRIPAIARSLGVLEAGLKWPDGDFDSIWIVTYRKGVAVMKRSKEGLKPGVGCGF